jgi:excisionase family DNA binding protein
MSIVEQINELRREMEELRKLVLPKLEPHHLLTMQESADFLRISISTMQKLSASKVIPSYKPGKGKVLFKREDLMNYLHSGRLHTQNQINS